MKTKDKQVLVHINDYCEKIAASVNRFGNDYDTFLSDNDFSDSVSMKIQQIGELAKLLSDEFIQETITEMPWNEIKGMRNFFAHEYAEMDQQQIWNTAVVDIPALQEFCRKYL